VNTSRIGFAACTVLITLMASAAVAAEQPACSIDSDCAKEEFCDTTPQCPGENVSGVCAARPQLCTMDYRPVTGCDGKEYPNACAAASAGQPHSGAAAEK
jgi:hypothetical protein